MVDVRSKTSDADATSQQASIEHLRKALEDGLDWPTSLLEAIALWTAPRETYHERTYLYLIDGEAFDWLLLAERLCEAVDGLLPPSEREDLLFDGRFPASFDASRFRDLLGVDKYRGYLNYFYGVTVEEALQLATELEVIKRHTSNGVQYRDDYSEEASTRIYRASQSELLKTFRQEKSCPGPRHLSLGESKEFTYWLFKYRMRNADQSRLASDTRKGLEQLRQMRKASHALNLPGEGTV